MQTQANIDWKLAPKDARWWGIDGNGEFFGGLFAAEVELAEVAKDETLVGLAAQHCFQQVVQFGGELGLWINAILGGTHSDN